MNMTLGHKHPTPSLLQQVFTSAEEEDLVKTVTNRLLDSQSFQRFLDQTLTIEMLVQTQHKAISVISETFPSDTLTLLLATYQQPGYLLKLIDSTPEAYCLKCGMTKETLKAMESGQLTVRTLLEQHQRVALAPLLNSSFSSSTIH